MKKPLQIFRCYATVFPILSLQLMKGSSFEQSSHWSILSHKRHRKCMSNQSSRKRRIQRIFTPIFAFVRVKFPSKDSHLRSFATGHPTELQRRTADYRNFFCPSKSIPEMSKNCQNACSLLTSCMMFAPPTYWKFATCVD